MHGNYLSQREIEIWIAFDLDEFAAPSEFKSMRELHDHLEATWRSRSGGVWSFGVSQVISSG